MEWWNFNLSLTKMSSVKRDIIFYFSKYWNPANNWSYDSVSKDTQGLFPDAIWVEIILSKLFIMLLYNRKIRIFINTARNDKSGIIPAWIERCCIRVGHGLARKYWTRLEKLASVKHSRLLQKSINYSRNKFYSTGPWWQKMAADLS
jgi:hypothetical protein